MTLEEFEYAVNNNSLPNTCEYNPKKSYIKLFREMNDCPSNFIEWAYKRRDRLSYFTIDELFESSSYSSAIVDRSLEFRNSHPELYDKKYKQLLEEISKVEPGDYEEWYKDDVSTYKDRELELGKEIIMNELTQSMKNRDCKFCGKSKPFSKLNHVFCGDKCYDEADKTPYYDDSS